MLRARVPGLLIDSTAEQHVRRFKFGHRSLWKPDDRPTPAAPEMHNKRHHLAPVVGG